MFSTGELIIYGSSGVYRVIDTGNISIKGCENRLYYTLEPVYGSGTSYVPVDTNVFMRRIMTADEANGLIDSIPNISGERFNSHSPRAIREHYSASMKSHDSTVLIGMIKELWEKSKRVGISKMSRIEQQYMEQAEDLVYGELAVSLGIERDAVVDYIHARLADA